MRASDLVDSARAVSRAAGILAVIAAVLWSTAYLTATSRTVLRLYEPAFDNTVAHRYVAKMRTADGAVFFLGGSSTHDGFDDGVMNAAAPAARFVNGGTGMGSIFNYEALAEMLRDSRVRPAVIVIGFHPAVLADRQIDFNGGGFTDFFDRWHGWKVMQLDDPMFRAVNRREALTNTFWPGHRLARQVSRLVRSALYRLHSASYWGPRLPRGAFEQAPDDLTPQPEYYRSATAPVPGSAADGVRWFQDTTQEWAAERHRESLRRTLDIALAITPHVVVLRMPEHSFLREGISQKIRDPLSDMTREDRFRNVVVLDRSHAMADDMFVDSIHLHRWGRERFSSQMAPEIEALWPPSVH